MQNGEIFPGPADGRFTAESVYFRRSLRGQNASTPKPLAIFPTEVQISGNGENSLKFPNYPYHIRVKL